MTSSFLIIDFTLFPLFCNHLFLLHIHHKFERKRYARYVYLVLIAGPPSLLICVLVLCPAVLLYYCEKCSCSNLADTSSGCKLLSTFWVKRNLTVKVIFNRGHVDNERQA